MRCALQTLSARILPECARAWPTSTPMAGAVTNAWTSKKACNATDQCTENAECSTLSQCHCLAKFYTESGKCFPSIKVGNPCHSSHQCTPNSVCATRNFTTLDLLPSEKSTCECLSEFYETSSGECERRSKVDKPCTSSDQCVLGATCVFPGVCKCHKGHYNTSDSQCAERIPPDQQCVFTHQCSLYSECVVDTSSSTDLRTCKCLSDYYTTPGKCVDRVEADKSCNDTDHCTPHCLLCYLF